MDSILFTPVEVELRAAAARTAIDARLAQLPDGELAAYWKAVAKIYARGLPEAEVSTETIEQPAVMAA